MFSRIKHAIQWICKKTYWYIEIDRAQDHAFICGLVSSCDHATAVEVLTPICKGNLPEILNADVVLDIAISHFPENDNDGAGRLEREKRAGKEEDPWISLMRRLPSGEQPLKNLLNAYNQEEETELHRQLSDDTTNPTAAALICRSSAFCEVQLERLRTGVARLPKLQKGPQMGRKEMCCFFLLLVAGLTINLSSEIIAGFLKENLAIARNSLQRPRNILQLGYSVFFFPYAGGWYMWELTRQRYLGAGGSFILFLAAVFVRRLYRNDEFIISADIFAAAFQLLIQTSDLISMRILHLKIRSQTGPPTEGDKHTYKRLEIVNARSVVWSEGFRKSKPMSILVMIYAKQRAMPRNVYATILRLSRKIVWDKRTVQKMSFFTFTLVVVWPLSAWGAWRNWYTFAIVNAFLFAASVKLLDIACAPEQEVGAALTTFCNMIASSFLALVCMLIPSGTNRKFLDNRNRFISVVTPVGFFTFWTDLIGEGLQWLFS